MPRRYLLVRLSALGDVINTLPAVSLLRRAEPDAFIGYAVEDRAKDVVLNHPCINRVFVFPRKRWQRGVQNPLALMDTMREAHAFVRAIRRERFDVALDFQGNLKGAMHAWISGAKRRIGFERGHVYEGNHWFSTERVTPPSDRPHRVEKFASLLQPLGIRPGPLEFVLPPSDESRRRVEAFLQSAGLPPGGYAAIHPATSSHGSSKRWPIERFGELARRILTELGKPVLITWGPGEEAVAAAVRDITGGRAVVSMPTNSLLDLAELIRRSFVFVSGDTGPMHLAAACHATCVALFGPKDPRLYRPYGSGHIVIHHPSENGEPAMEKITVEEVLAAVRQKGKA